MSWLLSNGTEDFRAEERAWANGRHGSWPPPPPEALLTDDPDLWLAAADLDAYAAAHPCDCEAICECDQEELEA